MKTDIFALMSLALVASCAGGAAEQVEEGRSGGARAAQTALPATLEATFDRVEHGWSRVERWRDNHPEFPAEAFPPDGRGDQDGQRRELFGSPRPHASRFLLYYGPNAERSGDDVPVLLVHGANDTPDRAWADPGEMGGFGCGVMVCPHEGLLQRLTAAGKRVFAVGFPQKQGDNYLHAQQIHDALAIVQSRTGAALVDVVGWSKGSFAARMYVSSVRLPWADAYAGNVRRLVLLGNPNLGFDYSFRHGIAHDVSVFPECGIKVNAPSPHTASTCWGQYVRHPELSHFATPAGDFYPGQRQMVARLDHLYPISTIDQDWYTTYHGGRGFFSDGPGIQEAIDQGGSLVDKILAASIPAFVTTYLLCGDTPSIPTIHNEHTGPSDGVVFTASCLETRAIGTVGDRRVVSGLNHLQLGWAPRATEIIADWLR